jgi:hypothetical protein
MSNVVDTNSADISAKTTQIALTINGLDRLLRARHRLRSPPSRSCSSSVQTFKVAAIASTLRDE